MNQILFTLSACSVLAACGGGGTDIANSNSNNSLVGAAVSLSATNYEPAAKEIVGSVSGLQSTGTATQGLLSGAQVTPITTPAMFLQAKLPELAQMLKRKAYLTGAVTSESVPCDNGGLMSVVFDDKNGNEDLDAGDSADISASNCLISNVQMNGKMTFTVNSGSADASSINLMATLQDFQVSIDDMVSVGNGSFILNMSGLDTNTMTIDMRSPSLTSQITQAGKTKVFQYKDYSINATASPTVSSWTVNGNVSVPILGANTANIETITRFSQPNNLGYATNGQLMITISNGGKLRVSATGTSNVKIELDLNSDGAYEEFKLTPWIDVL